LTTILIQVIDWTSFLLKPLKLAAAVY